MPLQNRVTPEGAITAVAQRGTMFGNRGGAFHRPDQTLLKRHFVSKRWICCVLAFKARHREVMQPNRYTELFFLDEATALAAGHRPCFECRRADALRFAELWSRTRSEGGAANATTMDETLHPERIARDGSKVVFEADVSGLPDGTFVRGDDGPVLLWRGGFHTWSFAGYRRAHAIRGGVPVLTPRSTVAVLAEGYRPLVHDTVATS